MYRSKVARVRREPESLCATFDALPGKVLHVIHVYRAGQSPDEPQVVYRSATLDSQALREVLPWVYAQWPREQGWAISIDAKVAHA